MNPELCAQCKHPIADHNKRFGSHVACSIEVQTSRFGWCTGFKSCGCGLHHKTPGTSPEVSETPFTRVNENERKHALMVSKNTPAKYTLPNGKEYIARSLGGFDDDVQGLRSLAKLGVHIQLLGEPGTGKTALVQAAFPDAENEIGHSKMQAPDMLYRPRIDANGNVVMDPAPLVRAATKGVPLYLDEDMRLSEDGWTPLFSAMDGRGFIVGGMPDGSDLPIKEGFVVIGASNPLVRNAFMPDAIASRFHILNVEVNIDLLTKIGLDERLLVVWRNLGQLNDGDMWVPSVRDLISAQRFIDEDNMPQAAFALCGWQVPARDRTTVAGVVGPLLGARVTDLGGVIK